MEEVCVGVSDATANIVVNEERKRESPFRYHQALEFESSEPKRKECVCAECSQKKKKKLGGSAKKKVARSCEGKSESKRNREW